MQAPETDTGFRASFLYDSYHRDGMVQKRFYWCSEAKNNTADSRIKSARLGVGEVGQPACPESESGEQLADTQTPDLGGLVEEG